MSEATTFPKSIRIDGLPESIKQKIMALTKANHGGAPVTSIQVDRALRMLDGGTLPSTKDGAWEGTNIAASVGRLALRFFAETPTATKQFKNYIGALQAQGRVVQRAPLPPRKKKNGHI